jgi:hypothetical protein
MTPEEHEALRQRYQFRCGYCGTSEVEAGAELTVDHFHPRSRGGLHEPNNWVYCCHACNEFKGNLWRPDSPQRILHPLRDNLAQHIIEQPDGTLMGLTETGRFHVQRLHLNRVPLVARRLEQRENGRWRQTVERLTEEVRALRQRTEEIERALRTLRERAR